VTIPSGSQEVRVSNVSYPTKLFRYGVQREDKRCAPSTRRGTPCQVVAITHLVDPQAMKNHALVFFGGLAAIVLLVGIAFGAASRRNVPPSAEAAPPPS
jgi:hypothetical protein